MPAGRMKKRFGSTVSGRKLTRKRATYFVEFGERLRLKEVIAGTRFPFNRKPIEDAMKGYAEEVAIVKATASVTNFEIIIDHAGLRAAQDDSTVFVRFDDTGLCARRIPR